MLSATVTPQSWRRVAIAMWVTGWGGNHFSPLMIAYREKGLADALVTGIFAIYAASIVPALLGAAWASQHYGKRTMVRLSMVLMVIASLLLALGHDNPTLLFAGRIAGGAGVGFVMGPGTAWIKELSADQPIGTGARRSTVAITAGFATGPIIAGLMAQYLPHPLEWAYYAHIVAQVLAAALVWFAPEIDTSDHPTPSVGAVAQHVLHSWFTKLILPSAPWVFGAASVSFAVMPALVGTLPGLPHLLAAGLTAGLTLGTSVLIQPTIKRFAAHDPGRTPPIAMSVLALGLVIATLGALFPHPAWLIPGAIVLGSAHGLLLVGAMTIAEHHTPTHLMAPVSAIVFCLTYIGFLAPFVVSLASLIMPPWAFLAAGVVVALLTLGWLWLERRDA